MKRVHLGAEEVADDAAGEAGLPLNERGGADEGLLPVDLLPKMQKRIHLALEMLFRHPLGDGADDHAAGFLGQKTADHLPQAAAELAALDLPANPDLGGVRHVD